MSLASALALTGLGLSGARAAPPGPSMAPAPTSTPVEVDEALDWDEPLEEVAPLPGKPLTAGEIAALERVMSVHEAMLDALERHRRDARAAGRALVRLADARKRVIEVDGRTLAELKVRMQTDLQAALSLPERLLHRIDRSAQRWLALVPDLNRLLQDDVVFDAMTRFSVPLL